MVDGTFLAIVIAGGVLIALMVAAGLAYLYVRKQQTNRFLATKAENVRLLEEGVTLDGKLTDWMGEFTTSGSGSGKLRQFGVNGFWDYSANVNNNK